ncbi:hypothetical protein QYE76_036438 [Lolium multiflorum]|uniref:Uncharacterized protein n=1 Tax=Lolium multiflorum TaxID=4521 RepID=A0AAD8R0X5_LOLMU|nr:hypothetical protein QYE76_036438 [Lolium multiflorum]
MPRPLPWLSFLCDGDDERLTYSCPATQGTLLSLQPKPPLVYSFQALLSKGPRCWEHLYTSVELNLHASCWNFFSPELPLYKNDWFIDNSLTDLIVQKNWDPCGMLQSVHLLLLQDIVSYHGILVYPRQTILMGQLGFQTFIRVCKTTYTCTHQWDPRILVGVFHVHSVGTLKVDMVLQYSFARYPMFGVKEWVQDIPNACSLAVSCLMLLHIGMTTILLELFYKSFQYFSFGTSRKRVVYGRC